MMAGEDKRVRRTRKLLRQALAELMLEKEFKNITVTDLVRRADINRGTFYTYYRDVYDLREKVENEIIDSLRAAIQDGLPTAAAEASMTPLIEQAVQCLENNRNLAYALLCDKAMGSFEEKLMSVIEDFCRLLHPPANEADHYSIWFIAAGCIGLLKKWMIEPVPAARGAVLAMLDNLFQRTLQNA